MNPGKISARLRVRLKMSHDYIWRTEVGRMRDGYAVGLAGACGEISNAAG
ncbi:MAG: hypothetical protein ACRD6N_00370 [Pyrinomonadaceae bacterium]